MKKSNRSVVVALLLLAVSLWTTAILALPDGFEMTTLTREVPSARQLAESDSGIIYAGSRTAGVVYAVVPNQSGNAPTVKVIAKNLELPSGIALYDGDLYIAALNLILRISNVDENLDSPELETITDSLPKARHHGWKYLVTDDVGNLYFNVGAPCNVCDEDDERFASILRMDPKTAETSVYAAGVRNSVGFAWHPVSGEMWFSDNGRDMMGPEVPFEEINVVTEPGQHFGFPYVHAGVVPDPVFGTGVNIEDYEKPIYPIRAHAAALGIAFYTADQFPSQYHNALFIAEHGSWNHAPGPPRGYRVTVLFETDEGFHYEPFIETFDIVDTDNPRGRPNDVLVARDGSLLISDDSKGAIFRVVYTGK